MTKSDLIEKVATQLNLPKGKAEPIIDCIFDSMEASLKDGQRVEIRGFGSFEIRRYKAYEGRNPRTGSPVGVNQKRLPFFKVGRELKERVNAGRGSLRAIPASPPTPAAKEPAAQATHAPAKESKAAAVAPPMPPAPAPIAATAVAKNDRAHGKPAAGRSADKSRA